MKLKWLLMAGAFATAAQFSYARVENQIDAGSTNSDVQVQVLPELSFVPASRGVWTRVRFTNSGTDPVTLTDWFIPGEDLDLPMFEVLRDGAAVAYLGALVKRGTPTAADLVVLQPGESLSVAVDLSGSYDFSAGGEYTIRYTTDSAHLFGPNQVGMASLRSPASEVFVEGRPSDAWLKAKPDRGTCSASQQSTIAEALAAATNMADGAQTYLNKTPPAGTPRYTTWFGAYSASGWDTATTHFDAIFDAFTTKPVTVDCSCKKSYYAYVYANQPYKIYVCNAFWTAPLTGTDSKGGTLIHEMSHFDVVASTSDWVYGTAAAKNLAVTDPAKALDNADNHEYFAENTPALR